MKATTNPESEAIRARFFEAFDEIKKSGKGSVYEFCRKHGLDESNVSKLKKNERQPIPAWYVAALSKDYKVSIKWVLFGTGSMF